MEIIVGYIFGVLYFKCIHLQEKKKTSLNYPYIVFGGNPCGLKNMLDSSMVNEPSGFEPLKFYCKSNTKIHTSNSKLTSYTFNRRVFVMFCCIITSTL